MLSPEQTEQIKARVNELKNMDVSALEIFKIISADNILGKSESGEDLVDTDLIFLLTKLLFNNNA